MNKLIITAALTGAEVTSAQQPALPISPEEIADAAYACAQAGAAMVHVHARLPDGTPTQDKEMYRQIIAAVKARCNVIVQVSTGGAVGMTPQERLAPLTLKPEMATLSMGSVNFGGDVFMNPPAEMEIFAAAMRDHGVKPELEIFDSGMLSTAQRWLKKGLLSGPQHFDFVLGIPGGMAGTPEALMYLRSQLPAQSSWTVAGIGPAQLSLGTLAMVLGGHVRVGFEDNVYYRKGELATSNAQLVARMARISQELDRPVATPDEARAMLGLS
ncbi:3-keto-5-aminohexanoate cleavage protein [Rhodoferax sp.]|uniref:3-keto-5-aminohexanoate cleavage enzyme n=1 Tax=Rhodoferax sp. TaxID=50421 RepID=UPI002734B022|nr:3-keto-5-aminohexanoate cleavage protein [Rhodoferax sp.]MDP3191801.1 3-keto-5-aminohexanoate cleavage protein [Rhodoferax sp.]MDP3336831.1 3-keto-5-aminohexanoate cleavage protein [Rhodoferax sp.]